MGLDSLRDYRSRRLLYLELVAWFFRAGRCRILLEPDACSQSAPCSVLFSQICWNPFSRFQLFTYVLLSLLRKNAFSIGEWEFYMPSPKLLASQFWSPCLTGPSQGPLFSSCFRIRHPVMALVYQRVYAWPIHGAHKSTPRRLGSLRDRRHLSHYPRLPAHGVVAALLVYRGVYYFLPLLAAAACWPARRCFRGKQEPRGFFRPSVTGHRTWCRRFSHSPRLSVARFSSFPAPLPP